MSDERREKPAARAARLERALLAYTAAAAGLVGAAPAAEAEIVYLPSADRSDWDGDGNLDFSPQGPPYEFPYWRPSSVAYRDGRYATYAVVFYGGYVVDGRSRFGAGIVPWLSGQPGDHYLGVHFTGDNAGSHFGWVRYQHSPGGGFILLDAAYETRPGVGIAAGDTGVIPEPASLGILALGAAGLALWRRPRER